MSMTMVRLRAVKTIDADKKEIFEKLYAEHEGGLRAFARKLTKNEADADDLFQESMLRAYRSFDLFEYGTNFGAWVHVIMRNSFYTERRKNKLRPALLEIGAMEAASSAIEQSAEEASRETVTGPEDLVRQ